jgi:maltose O-acetyltransferase
MNKITYFFSRVIHLIKGECYIPPKTQVGKNVYIGVMTTIDGVAKGRYITIEDNVTIADGVRILCHDASSENRLDVNYVAPVKICEGAYIGCNAIILPGVIVGRNAVVAAGSIVTKNVDDNTVVAGNPARFLEMIDDLDKKRRLKMDKIKIYNLKEYRINVNNEEYMMKMDKDIFAGGGIFFIEEMN